MASDDPADDELAVAADALASEDPARAELITTQLALAACGIETVEALIGSTALEPAAYARAAALLRRQNVLVAHHGPRWARELVGPTSTPAELGFRGGRVVGLACDPDEVDAIARAFERAPSLRALELTAAPDDAASFAAIAEVPGLARVTALTVGARTTVFDEISPAAWFGALPRLATLRWHDGDPINPRVFAACPELVRVEARLDNPDLARASITLARATDLRLGVESWRVLDGRFARATRIAMSIPSTAPAFELALPPELEVSVLADRANVLAGILASPAMARVRVLRIALVSLDRRGTPKAGDMLLAALVRSRSLDALESLELDGFERSDGAPLIRIAAPRLGRLDCDATVALASVPELVARFPLRALALHRVVGDDDAGERIASGETSARLRELTLPGFTDLGLGAIGGSPHVRGLRRFVPAGFARLTRAGFAMLGERAAMPELVSLGVAVTAEPVAACAPHANLVEVRDSSRLDQLARVRLRARYGTGAIDTSSREHTRAVIAIIDVDPAIVAALFAELAPRAMARADAPHTLLRVWIPGGGELAVVSCIEDCLRLELRPADAIARAEVERLVALLARTGGTVFREEPVS